MLSLGTDDRIYYRGCAITGITIARVDEKEHLFLNEQGFGWDLERVFREEPGRNWQEIHLAPPNAFYRMVNRHGTDWYIKQIKYAYKKGEDVREWDWIATSNINGERGVRSRAHFVANLPSPPKFSEQKERYKRDCEIMDKAQYLIAAAPEMYWALENILKAYKKGGESEIRGAIGYASEVKEMAEKGKFEYSHQNPE